MGRQCEKLKSAAIELTSRIAKLLPGLNPSVKFDYDFDDEPPAPLAGSFDEYDNGIVIHLPDYCAFADSELPAEGNVFFVISHEVGHNLLDLVPPKKGWHPVFATELAVSEELKRRHPYVALSDTIISKILGEILHMNTDSMGLLILRALKVDIETVLTDSQEHLRKHPVNGGIGRMNDVFRFRYEYQMRMLNSQAPGFLPSARICLLPPVKEFLVRYKFEADLKQLQKYFFAFTKYSAEPREKDILSKEVVTILSADCFTASPKALADAFDWYVQENLKMGIDKINTYKTLDIE